jgi:hypothetical protein
VSDVPRMRRVGPLPSAVLPVVFEGGAVAVFAPVPGRSDLVRVSIARTDGIDIPSREFGPLPLTGRELTFVVLFVMGGLDNGPV